MTPSVRSFLPATALLVCLLMVTPLAAQQSAAQPPAPDQSGADQTKQPAQKLPDAPSTTKTEPPAKAQLPVKADMVLAKDGGTKNRILGMAPQFGAVDASITQPLTPSQKWHLFVRSNIDPFIFIAQGITAGISQAQDGHPGYGQGMTGYGKRYGSGLADQIDGNFWGNFILPVVLKEDPRYFRKGMDSIGGRAWYAFTTTVVTRTDRGNHRFNYSNVLGNFISGGISNAYYPKDDRGFGLTMSNAAVVTLPGGLGAQGEEFWPDIDCHFIHLRQCREQKQVAVRVVNNAQQADSAETK